MNNETAIEDRQTYDVAAAARVLGCSRSHLYDLIQRGELPGVIRLGRRIVISKRAIEGC